MRGSIYDLFVCLEKVFISLFGVRFHLFIELSLNKVIAKVNKREEEECAVIYVCRNKTIISEFQLKSDMENIENEKVKSKREAFLERFKNKRPDVDVDDEEALWGAISDDTDDMSGRLSRQEEIDRAMSDRFENDPSFGGFFLDALGGKSPVVAFIERYGEDIRNYLDDPEKAEELAEANRKYLERISQESELETQYNTNLEASLAVAEELEKEGYNEDQINQAFEAVLTDAQKAILGEITREMLETKLKGLNYDNDIAEAEQVAEVRGKNTKIEEKMKKLSPDENLPPMIEGKGTASTPKKGNKTTDALDRLTRKPNIFEGIKYTSRK